MCQAWCESISWILALFFFFSQWKSSNGHSKYKSWILVPLDWIRTIFFSQVPKKATLGDQCPYKAENPWTRYSLKVLLIENTRIKENQVYFYYYSMLLLIIFAIKMQKGRHYARRNLKYLFLHSLKYLLVSWAISRHCVKALGA